MSEASDVAQAAAALALIAATVFVHVAGFLVVLRRLQPVRRQDPVAHGLGYVIRLLLTVILLMILLHVVEVFIWAGLYAWVGAFPDFRTALFYSLGSYSTVGAEGLRPARQWEMLGGLEGLVGALMFGLSTAFIFAVMNAINQMWRHKAASKNP
jgi:hypothetical protein